MSLLHAFLLGILEGLTEFLPVSSTGHLYLLGELLGHTDDATKALDVVMQLGAVFAVVIYYRGRLLTLVRGLLERKPESVRLLVALVAGFLPAAVIGLAFHKRIKESLMSPLPVAGALIVGGVVMLVVEAVRRRGATTDPGDDGLDKVTPRRALAIGFAQCFSLWPGVSRSMATIVGGQLTGLNTATAAEFSFFLFIPTLGAATLFDLYKHGHEILAAPGGTGALVVSMATAFVVAFAAIAGFLSYLKRRGLAPFGVYRIVVGSLAVWYFWTHAA
jgi:undecaprenyl-diphosphatase